MKQILKGTLVLSIMSIVSQIGSVLLLPIYSRLITPDMYGILGLLAPFSTFVITIIALGFPTAESRDLVEYDKDPNALGSYLFTINVFLIGLSGVALFVLLFLPTRNLILSILGLGNIPFHFILLSFISTVVSNFVLMVNTYLNFVQKYISRAILSLVVFFLNNGVSLYIIFSSGDGVMGEVVGGLVAQLAVAIILGYGYIRKFKPHFKMEFVRSSLHIGIPVTITGIFLALSNSGNRFIMNEFLPLGLVGQFTIAWTITSPISILFASFHAVWMPEFFKSLRDQRSRLEIENRILAVLVFTTALIFLAQLFIADLAGVILNEQYHAGAIMSVSLLPYFLTLALSSLLGDYLIYFRKTHFTTVVYIAVGLFSLGANYLLIPILGIQASIALMTIIQAIVSVGFFAILFFRFNLRFRYWRYALLLLLVFNPVAVQVGEETVTHISGLVAKAAYSLVVFGILVWVLPEKATWLQRLKQFIKVNAAWLRHHQRSGRIASE